MATERSSGSDPIGTKHKDRFRRRALVLRSRVIAMPRLRSHDRETSIGFRKRPCGATQCVVGEPRSDMGESGPTKDSTTAPLASGVAESRAHEEA
jgi:hypothetical protein